MEIALSQNKFALVDDCDYEFLNQWKWSASKNKNTETFYAKCPTKLSNGKRTSMFMHHAILGKPDPGFWVDHIDGNGLNNQKSNLRFVTIRQNLQNQVNRNKSSKYPGVSWHKHCKKWSANIRINGKLKHLGYFIEEKMAFESYKNAINAIGER